MKRKHATPRKISRSRDLPSNWCATPMSKKVMSDLPMIAEEGKTKVKNDEFNYNHCRRFLASRNPIQLVIVEYS